MLYGRTGRRRVLLVIDRPEARNSISRDVIREMDGALDEIERLGPQALIMIVEAGRSAIGKRNGSLARTHPADVLGPVQMAVLRRADVDPGSVDQVVGGCINKVSAPRR